MAQLAVESDDFDDQPGDYRPDMSEDGTLSIALRDIGNQLRALRMDLVAVNGSRPQQIKMLEGPKTAIEIAAARKAWRDHYSLTARLLPHKAAEMQGKIAELSD